MPIAERGQTSPIEIVSGLEGVPNVAASVRNQRIRQVLPTGEFEELEKLARRAERWGKPHGLLVKYRLECELEQCPDKRVRIQSDASAPSGAVLRCGCTDRVFARRYTPPRGRR